jgi:hypothetical protein
LQNLKRLQRKMQVSAVLFWLSVLVRRSLRACPKIFAIMVRRRTSLSMRMPMLPCHARSMASVPTALESPFVQYDLIRGNGSVFFDKV